MKEKYLNLMELSLSAYTYEHIVNYFEEVKKDGLTEHGFPRLTVNIGIMIAHGRRCDLLPLFLEMMEFCCKNIPKVKAANDFSVREIICCILELEKSGIIGADEIKRWRSYMASITPELCYDQFAKKPNDNIRNWALFTGVSEYFRQYAGLCDSNEFIDVQIASQMQWLDENGMYMDHSGEEIHQPIMYEIAPRGLFALLLHFGYQGNYRQQIDENLKKSGLLTLKMQSSNGEMAFGGRSNQFIHNEAWLAAIFEYEANRYAKEGNNEQAAIFKAAIARALSVTERWLTEKLPISHIKNRFPRESRYGCEKYAYFDKYMITTASNLYAAYLMCDDTIVASDIQDCAPSTFKTSSHFHKAFLKSGGYSLEFDINADPNYDANGLGRIHKAGAPSAICLSVPCPSSPKYNIDIQNTEKLSLCPGIIKNGEWQFATDEAIAYSIDDLSQDDTSAFATVSCRFPENEIVNSKYTVNSDGVQIKVAGDGKIAYLLPAFCFDGETSAKICSSENCLTVEYDGWICRYLTDGIICDCGKLAANRNGHYKVFYATAENTLKIKIEIFKL